MSPTMFIVGTVIFGAYMYFLIWNIFYSAKKQREENYPGLTGIEDDIVDYDGTSNADAFLDIDAEVFLGMQVFFYNLMNALVSSIPNYLAKMEKEVEKGTYSQPNGESIKNYIHSLKETSETLKQSLK